MTAIYNDGINKLAMVVFNKFLKTAENIGNLVRLYFATRENIQWTISPP
jgi:hypothetical protein